VLALTSSSRETPTAPTVELERLCQTRIDADLYAWNQMRRTVIHLPLGSDPEPELHHWTAAFARWL
jgi:hypothetical protein